MNLSITVIKCFGSIGVSHLYAIHKMVLLVCKEHLLYV